MTRTCEDIAAAAQLACLLEVTAPKPGNVSPRQHFDDVAYEHFLASATAIGPAMGQAGHAPLGQTVLRAIQATRRWTTTNTNLGMVLLFAPLACAAAREFASARELRQSVAEVLCSTTVDDARGVYEAIRLASPGGLGRVESQDVHDEPTVSLREAMMLAAAHDAIAREYASEFTTTFDVAVPALTTARRDALSWSDAIVQTFLTLLAAEPDTHIARRAGAAAAAEVTELGQRTRAAGGVRTPAGRRAIDDLDRALRHDGHMLNPGATADVTAAAIFVALLQGEWHTEGRAR